MQIRSRQESDMERALVIFDDSCSMCTRSVRVLGALDWLRQFRTAGFYSALNAYPELGTADIDEGVRVRFPDGSYTVGIDAVRSMAMRTPLGALVGWLLYIPPLRAIGARVYGYIARRRHRSCRLPQT
jgi:predicted DCC family thiol-disulfide oxidoreductase YuxK